MLHRRRVCNFRLSTVRSYVDQTRPRRSDVEDTAPPAMSSVNIPDGLLPMLKELTVAILVEQPADIYQFAIDHLTTARTEQHTDHTGLLITEGGGKLKTEKSYHRRVAISTADQLNPEYDTGEGIVTYPKTLWQRQRLKEAVKEIMILK